MFSVTLQRENAFLCDHGRGILFWEPQKLIYNYCLGKGLLSGSHDYFTLGLWFYHVFPLCTVWFGHRAVRSIGIVESWLPPHQRCLWNTWYLRILLFTFFPGWATSTCDNFRIDKCIIVKYIILSLLMWKKIHVILYSECSGWSGVLNGHQYNLIYFFSQLDVLEYIHENEYVHADIKAANLLLGYRNPHQVNTVLSFCLP